MMGGLFDRPEDADELADLELDRRRDFAAENRRRDRIEKAAGLERVRARAKALDEVATLAASWQAAGVDVVGALERKAREAKANLLELEAEQLAPAEIRR